MTWVLWFFVGMIFGGFGLICLALCQIQKKEDEPATVYFVASIEVEGVKVYLDRKGIWGSFSLTDTLITANVKDMVQRFEEITGQEMDNEVGLEKMWIDTKFIQSF